MNNNEFIIYNITLYTGLVIRSVCKQGDRFLIGSQDGEIYNAVLGDPGAKIISQGKLQILIIINLLIYMYLEVI